MRILANSDRQILSDMFAASGLKQGEVYRHFFQLLFILVV
jgi:hypothetical protein